MKWDWTWILKIKLRYTFNPRSISFHTQSYSLWIWTAIVCVCKRALECVGAEKLQHHSVYYTHMYLPRKIRAEQKAEDTLDGVPTHEKMQAYTHSHTSSHTIWIHQSAYNTYLCTVEGNWSAERKPPKHINSTHIVQWWNAYPWRCEAIM